jgi:hypothetical protein
MRSTARNCQFIHQSWNKAIPQCELAIGPVPKPDLPEQSLKVLQSDCLDSGKSLYLEPNTSRMLPNSESRGIQMRE